MLLDDEVEEELRSYISREFAQGTYGKLSQVVNDAVTYFLKKFQISIEKVNDK